MVGACTVAAMAAHAVVSLVLGALMVALFKSGTFLYPPYVGIPFLYVRPLSDAEDAKRAFYISVVLYSVFISLLSARGSLRRALRAALSGRPSALLGNGLAALLLTYGVTLLLSLAASAATEAAGVPVGTLPKDDPVMQFIGVSLAPLNEELLFRLLLIGVPALLIMRRRGLGRLWVLRALWRPGSASGGLRPSLQLLVIASAAIFGLAHLAGGWEPGKFFPAAIAGIALGELYVLLGLHAAIMLHWLFNYEGTVSYYLGQVAPSLITSIYDQASTLFELAAALISVVLLAYIALERLASSRLKGAESVGT